MRQHRYWVHPVHFGKRARERKLSIEDAKHAIEHATACLPYHGRQVTEGGTNWRVIGPSLDDGSIAIGVEAYEAPNGEAVLIITLFSKEKP